MVISRLLLTVAAAAPLAVAAGPGVAADESYPSRVVTMVVPYAAGGPSDTVGRILAEALTEALGQQVIVENVAGASGSVGAGRVAKAEPDGYTLLLHTPAHATNTLLFRTLPYDPATAFQPIGLVTETPSTLVGRPDLPPNSAGELFDYIRENKADVTIGNGGIGGPSHLCSLLIMDMLDAEMTPVPYKGTGPAMVDVLGGQIDLVCDQATNTIGYIKGGKVKAYAVTAGSRMPELPDLPTLDEAGLEGFETSVWHGLYAPQGTPEEVVGKLADTLRTVLHEPEVVERLAALATTPVAPDRVNPEALQARLKAEIAKWQPIVQAAGVTAE
jgi:tripartite-type tricarboxylate transporter receptor subunit TctC